MEKPSDRLGKMAVSDRRSVIGGLLGSAVATTLLTDSAARAQQQWPSTTLKLVVPYTPGGAADTLARMAQDGVGNSLGHPIIVENKPGGSGIPGTDAVIRSADGHTFGLIVSVHASSVALKMAVPYDPIADIAPLTMLGRVPLVLVVHPSVKATTVPELFQEVKASGKKTFAATSGAGTAGHFAVELLNLEAGIKIEPVHYKGAAPAVQDLIGGQVQMQFATISSVWPHVEAGKLRALAVSKANRTTLRPEIPTVKEQTKIDGFDFAEWYGLIAPPKMAADHIGKLRAALVKAIDSKTFQDKARLLGIEAKSSSSDEMRQIIKDDIERLTALVQRANIKLE